MADNRTELQVDINAQLEAQIQRLFNRFPKSIDWAEDLAREIIANAFNLNESIVADINRYQNDPASVPEDLAFSLATALALEVRHMRSGFHDEATSLARQKLKDEFTSDEFLLDLIRSKAAALDKRGWTHEANVLRETSTIIEAND